MFAVWYRQNGSDHNIILSFDGEWERLDFGMAGSFVVREFNIWDNKLFKQNAEV